MAYKAQCDLSLATLQQHLMPPLPKLPTLQYHQQTKIFFGTGRLQVTFSLPTYSSARFSQGWECLTCGALLNSLFLERGLPGHPGWPTLVILYSLPIFNMWDSFTQFLVYSSNFCLDFLLVHLPPLYYKISERSDHFSLVHP